MTQPTLSLAIPAYNEAETIGWLLESLLTELADIEEIIVVDNNSTDETADIVAGFYAKIPQLRMIKETKRGVIAARNAGFDVAKGDIIGRLDADARAKPGWAAAVRTFFANADDSIGAGTGFFDQYDMPLQFIHKKLLNIAFDQAQKNNGDVPSLFGANMAVRASTWKQIRPLLLEQNGIFDDLDITLCVKEIGQRNVYVPGMAISASGRRMLSDTKTYAKFTAYMPATYEARGMTAEAKRSRAEVRTMRIMHRVFWVPSRAWNPATGHYSLRQLFSKHKQRVLPYDTTRA
ncbi:glycosyl transferase family 2 [Williamsia limnetica]|uniref:Glycosyl transferase family 2 n=1 Tax=Williamsia limnetica TaxID=882452 RepID=A0A318RI80_WILLI|nr:glycosyltransferase family 2 protein [Williamsia limnetica]PYE13119.1 glycosyl transferase family 2 [Williamsia limnetica]